MKTKSRIFLVIALVAAITVFHILILFGIIPYEFVWGGRLKNDAQMYISETVSIVLNLLLIVVLLMKADQIKPWFSPKVLSGILWFFVILFGLNTIGNLLAETVFEKSFAVVTLFLAIMIFMLLKKENLKKNELYQ